MTLFVGYRNCEQLPIKYSFYEAAVISFQYAVRRKQSQTINLANG